MPFIFRTLMPTLLALSASTLLPTAQAAAPRTIPVQGRLTNSSGAPVNGTPSVTFRLYRSATDAIALWSESEDLSVQDGQFHATLGDGTPFPAAVTFAEPYYLGISVAGEAEMAPRMALGAAPYALALPNVSVTPDGNVGIGTPTPGARLTVAGPVESTGGGYRFPDGTLQNTAADLGRFARAPFRQGFVSGLSAGDEVRVSLDGALAKTPVTLAAPYTTSIEAVRVKVVDQTGQARVRIVPGRFTRGSVVLRRVLSVDRDWADWYRATEMGTPSLHDLDIRLYRNGVEVSRWSAEDGWVSRYKLRLADDGFPVEEITLEYDQGKHLRRIPSPAFSADLPTTAVAAGFTSGLRTAGRAYQVALNGVALTAAIVASDVGPSTSVVEYRSSSETSSVRYLPGTPDPGTITVRQNPAAGTGLHELFEQILQGHLENRATLSLDLAPDLKGLIKRQYVWPCSITLRLADDGLPVEDIELIGEAG